jgi:glycosyltransferase involved in cell wall biosynthesis
MEGVSVVVLTKNEEKDIKECLESVKWASEIVIVDDCSTDATVQVCRHYTDKIFQRKMLHFSDQREFGLRQASFPWVLTLDADQVVTPGLREEIQGVLQQGTEYDGFMIYKITSYLGRWMRHCGWRVKVLVLSRKDKTSYDGKAVHENAIVQGKIGELENEILHKNYESLSEHFTRMDLYTSYDAEDLWKKGVRLNYFNYPVYFFFKPLYIFFRKYIMQRGFQEGVRGFFISVVTAFVVFMNYAKLWDKQRNETKR